MELTNKKIKMEDRQPLDVTMTLLNRMVSPWSINLGRTNECWVQSYRKFSYSRKSSALANIIIAYICRTNLLNSRAMKDMNFNILMLSALSLGVSCTRIDCSETPITRRYSDMTGFNAVDVSHAFEVHMIPSDREEVELVIPPDAAKYAVVRKNGETLHIGMKPGHSYRFVHERDECCLKAIVYFKVLSKVTASGASEVDIEGFMTLGTRTWPSCCRGLLLLKAGCRTWRNWRSRCRVRLRLKAKQGM